MAPIDFCHWLQGFIDGNGLAGLPQKQSDCLSEHLRLVFEKSGKAASPPPQRKEDFGLMASGTYTPWDYGEFVPRHFGACLG